MTGTDSDDSWGLGDTCLRYAGLVPTSRGKSNIGAG